jgi:hypothetical protein
LGNCNPARIELADRESWLDGTALPVRLQRHRTAAVPYRLGIRRQRDGALLALRQRPAHLHRREPDTAIGHNAAGGWMVLAMLAMLAVQVATGLCANDDGDTEGPLFKYVSKDRSDWLSHIHAVNFKVIQIAVLLHIVAILIYLGLKRHDLVRPMITGRKHLPEALQPPMLASPMRAVVLFAVAAVAVGVAVNAL